MMMAPLSKESGVLEGEFVQPFRIKDGQIVYQVGGGQVSSHLDNDWFGCSFCNRWFQHLRQLEAHYGREHEGEESYKFELLELRNCVIRLPYIWCKSGVVTYKVTSSSSSNTEIARPDSKKFVAATTTLDGDTVGRKLCNAERKKSLKRGIRDAIKATEREPGEGTSFKRIKSFILKTQGLQGNKFEKILRRTLERFVGMRKLSRRYSRGKTLYALWSRKCPRANEQPGKEVRPKITKEVTRHFNDKQLKQVVKSLKPHGCIAPKKKNVANKKMNKK